MLQGGKNVEIDSAVPGDIAAVAKVDEIEFDCVLHDSHDEDHIHMRPLEFPTPMQGVALAPKKRGDEQRIWEVLHRLTAEDPKRNFTPSAGRSGDPSVGQEISPFRSRGTLKRSVQAGHTMIA